MIINFFGCSINIPWNSSFEHKGVMHELNYVIIVRHIQRTINKIILVLRRKLTADWRLIVKSLLIYMRTICVPFYTIGGKSQAPLAFDQHLF